MRSRISGKWAALAGIFSVTLFQVGGCGTIVGDLVLQLVTSVVIDAILQALGLGTTAAA